MDTNHYSTSYCLSNLPYVTAQLLSEREAFHVQKCITETNAFRRVRKIERKDY